MGDSSANERHSDYPSKNPSEGDGLARDHVCYRHALFATRCVSHDHGSFRGDDLGVGQPRVGRRVEVDHQYQDVYLRQAGLQYLAGLLFQAVCRRSVGLRERVARRCLVLLVAARLKVYSKSRPLLRHRRQPPRQRRLQVVSLVADLCSV